MRIHNYGFMFLIINSAVNDKLKHLIIFVAT